jgi:hypothetical protein
MSLPPEASKLGGPTTVNSETELLIGRFLWPAPVS